MASFAPSLRPLEKTTADAMRLKTMDTVANSKNSFDVMSQWLYDESMHSAKQATLEKYRIDADARDEAYKIAGEGRAEAGLMDETRPQGMEFASKMKTEKLKQDKYQKEIDVATIKKLPESVKIRLEGIAKELENYDVGTPEYNQLMKQYKGLVSRYESGGLTAAEKARMAELQGKAGGVTETPKPATAPKPTAPTKPVVPGSPRAARGAKNIPTAEARYSEGMLSAANELTELKEKLKTTTNNRQRRALEAQIAKLEKQLKGK